MSDIDQAADIELEDAPARRRGKSRLKLYLMILVGLVVLGVVGGGVWYFLLGGKDVLSPPANQKVEAPLPYFFEVKPFVVTTASRSGPPRFVQLGLSLEMPSSNAGDLVTAILPQVTDAVRQSVLGFKSEDLQSPDGLEKVRAALMASISKTLIQNLGNERIEKVNPGKPPEALVTNVYFSQLIVE